MADDTQARAQRVWAELGGIGPLSWRDMRPDLLIRELADGQPDAVEYARLAAAHDRQRLRLRFIEAALPAVTSQVNAHAPEAVANAAIDIADAVLARLEAEAKAGST